MGFEYVSGYTNSNGTYVNSFCRKIKHYGSGNDPDSIEKKLQEKEMQESRDRAYKIYFGENEAGGLNERKL